jgi:hypothetical protein
MNDIEHKASDSQTNNSDSKADAIAIFLLVMIAAGAMIYLASN